MGQFLGIIALDIDGTITAEKHFLPPRVKQALHSYHDAGWKLVFLTGRTFAFALTVMNHLEVPYLIGVQNGASLISMPEKKLIKKHYLTQEKLGHLIPLFSDHRIGFLIESGWQNEDLCYYRRKSFCGEDLVYLDYRSSLHPEEWQVLDSYEEFPLKEFAVAKFFAEKNEASTLVEQLHQNYPEQFATVVMSDPFRPGFSVVLINEHGGSKAHMLQEIEGHPIIAGGDDHNDIEMLRAADVRIVMGTAPEEVKKLAHIIAAPASEEGIIEALKTATAP